MSDEVNTKVEARELSRWRKWSWESECVYGEEEIIPAAFQKVTQKYIEGEGWGTYVIVAPAAAKRFL